MHFAGRTYTVAGSGFEGYVDGDIAMARFNRPHGLAVDYDGYIYVADTHNHVIRKIDPHKGLVSTVAGDGVAGYVRICSVLRRHGSARGGCWSQVESIRDNCVCVPTARTGMLTAATIGRG